MKADIIIFPDGNRSEAALVVEVKHNKYGLTDRDFGQARSYAIELHAPLYLVTNSDDSKLMKLTRSLYREATVLSFRRSELRERWPDIVEHLSRDVVLET